MLAEYLARHAPDAMTGAMNAVCDRLTEKDDEFARAAALRILKREARL